MNALSIILPAYNEVVTLADVVWDITAFAKIALDDYEILLVDDGSTDATGGIADGLAIQLARVRVLHQGRNRGVGAAYAWGLTVARCPYVTFLPADGEIAPGSIGAFFAAVGDADLVVTYHANPEDRPWHRRLLTWGATALVNRLFGFRLRYYQGPVVYPTELARRLPKTAGGFYFLTQMLVHALAEGHTYTEVGLVHRPRQAGTSRAVSLRNIVRALRTMLTTYWALRMRGGGTG